MYLYIATFWIKKSKNNQDLLHITTMQHYRVKPLSQYNNITAIAFQM
jgi:hypothetical protein